MSPQRWVALVTVALLTTACPKKDDVIVEAAEGKALSNEAIDKEPLALLPGGAVAVGAIDAKKTFASEFGKKLLELAEKRSPLPAAASFEPRRDLDQLYFGVYSMQGADSVVVARGRFNKTAIEQTAEGQKTPLGVPLIRSSYADRALFTAVNIGFSVITDRTIILGNETGIRRALDRIKEGRARVEVPRDVFDPEKNQGAPLVMAFDLTAHPLTDAAKEQLPFLNGVKTGGMLANFESPGINLAGSLTYGDEAAAQAGAAQLMQINDFVKAWGWAAALLGISQPIKNLSAKADGVDTKFVAGLDAQAILKLLDQAMQYLGVQNQPKVIDATTSPGLSEEPPE